MNTFEAFARSMAANAAGSRGKVFDWDRAARRIVETGAKDAGAGLARDWEWTGGAILRDGKPVPKYDTYTYLKSSHATPELSLNGALEDCFIDPGPETNPQGWDEHTYWPASALAILNAGRA